MLGSRTGNDVVVHYTFPALLNSARPPICHATVAGDDVQVRRRPVSPTTGHSGSDPWYVARVQTFDFVRVAEPLRWPRDNVLDPGSLLPPESGAGAA